MTARRRRDKPNKGASVISGLRLERDVANDLCEAADKRAGGDVAELARFFIRTGLGHSDREANSRETNEYLHNSGLAGLTLDRFTKAELAAVAGDRGISKAGLARHFIRRGLGYTDAESTKREAGFAALAEVYQGRSETFHGAK